MKYIVCALIVCGLSAVLAGDNLGTVIENFLVKLKKKLPCGFDQSFAPYILADGAKKIHVLDIDSPDFM